MNLAECESALWSLKMTKFQHASAYLMTAKLCKVGKMSIVTANRRDNMTFLFAVKHVFLSSKGIKHT